MKRTQPRNPAKLLKECLPMMRSMATRLNVLLAVGGLLVTLLGSDSFAQSADANAIEESIPAGLTVTGIEVVPKTVQLDQPFAYQQLLVQGQLDSGETIDLTRMAAIEPSEPVVAVDEFGLVRPQADGETTVTVRFQDYTASIPCTVTGQSGSYHPSFIRDIQPVMSRLGCNQGTCHGAKDGKEGFKLSLRGYDPLYDFAALTDEIGARRFNRVAPDQSLMLLKASGAIPHVGGGLTQPGEPYYELLREWIAQGVQFDLETSPKVVSIAVEPQLPVLPRANMVQQMRVLATYTDGSVRDVTHEAFVESGNIEVLESLPGGRLKMLRRGESAVLVRYEGAYASTTLTVMGDRSGFAWEQQPVFNYIDELVDEKLQRVRVSSSPLCSDDEFIRRIYLDLTGLPPTANTVREFLADTRPTQVKRDAVVDQLVGSREFVDFWTNKWSDLLQVNRKFLGEVGAVSLRNWIHDRVAMNTPYDEFARDILTATGSNVDNPPAAYWKVLRDPADAMENTTHLFLAIRFNCNKCHDHPFERWTQDQYYELAAYFAQVNRKEDPAFAGQRIGGSAVEGAVPLVEVVYDSGAGEIKHDRTGAVTPPHFPYEHAGNPGDVQSRRDALAQWMTSAENPYFARSYVNRLWGYLLGQGIIEPIDDIRAGNPPTNPALLDALEDDFVASGFDIQHMMRVICKSRAYQLSVRTDEWNADDTINYSHAMPRRLPAEVLFDAFHYAAGAPFKIPGAAEGVRAAELPDAGVTLPFLDDFGRPVRETACECERSSGVALGPVMKLVNGPSLATAITDPTNDITRLTQEISDDRLLVEELFLRFLARYPTEREMELGLETLAAPGTDLPERQAELAAYRNEIAQRLPQWEANLQRQVSWQPLPISQATSDLKADFKTLDDGSVLASGNMGHDTYHLTVETPVAGITGLRLEALTHPDLPSNGPGRAQNGNFVIHELIVEQLGQADAPSTPLALRNAQADFSQANFDVAGLIDGNEGSGWAISPQTGKPHQAQFEFETPVETAGSRLVVKLVQKYQDQKHLVGRVKLSYTTSPTPLQTRELPEALAKVLAVPQDQRTEEQQAFLLDQLGQTDLRYKRLVKAVEQSRMEAENPRLTGVQDLAWALVNNPSFLFNR